MFFFKNHLLLSFSTSLSHSFPPLSFLSVNLEAVISSGLADLQQEDRNIWIIFSKIIPLRSYLPCWHTHKTVRAETPIGCFFSLTSSRFITQYNFWYYTYKKVFCKSQLRLLKWFMVSECFGNLTTTEIIHEDSQVDQVSELSMLFLVMKKTDFERVRIVSFFVWHSCLGQDIHWGGMWSLSGCGRLMDQRVFPTLTQEFFTFRLR